MYLSGKRKRYKTDVVYKITLDRASAVVGHVCILFQGLLRAGQYTHPALFRLISTVFIAKENHKYRPCTGLFSV